MSLLPLASAMGASYSIDFSSYTSGASLNGQDGWTQSPADDEAGFPVSWVYDNSGITAGAIGGYYGIPAGLPATVGRSFTSLDAGAKSVSFQGTIVDSSTLFPTRDSFGYSIRDGSGDTLLTVSLVPDNPNPANPDTDDATYQIFYAFGTGPLVSASNSISEGGLYTFGLTFDASGAVFSFSTLSQTFTFSGNPTGVDENDGTLVLEYNWQSDDGDNFLLFDNISVGAVPEPSAALLGLGALGLLARRRRR